MRELKCEASPARRPKPRQSSRRFASTPGLSRPILASATGVRAGAESRSGRAGLKSARCGWCRGRAARGERLATQRTRRSLAGTQTSLLAGLRRGDSIHTVSQVQGRTTVYTYKTYGASSSCLLAVFHLNAFLCVQGRCRRRRSSVGLRPSNTCALGPFSSQAHGRHAVVVRGPNDTAASQSSERTQRLQRLEALAMKDRSPHCWHAGRLARTQYTWWAGLPTGGLTSRAKACRGSHQDLRKR